MTSRFITDLPGRSLMSEERALTVRLPVELDEKLRKKAFDARVSKAKVFRQLLREKLDDLVVKK